MTAWLLLPLFAPSGGILELVSQNETKIIFRSGDKACELEYSSAGELVSSCPIKSSSTQDADDMAAWRKSVEASLAELKQHTGLVPPSSPPISPSPTPPPPPLAPGFASCAHAVAAGRLSSNEAGTIKVRRLGALLVVVQTRRPATDP